MTQYVTQIIQTGQRLQGTSFKIEVMTDVIKTKLLDKFYEASTVSGSGCVPKGTHQLKKGNSRHSLFNR